MGVRLRRTEGLRPFARTKPQAASRLVGASYPFQEIGNSSQGVIEITPRSAHDKREDVAPSATPKAVEDLFLGVNVERRIAFGVEWTEANELTPRATKRREPGHELAQIGPRL
jgi:hypothetical protein